MDGGFEERWTPLKKMSPLRHTFWKWERIHSYDYILSVSQEPCVKVWFRVRWCDFWEVSASERCSGQQGNILDGHSGIQDTSSFSPSFPSQKMVSFAPALSCHDASTMA